MLKAKMTEAKPKFNPEDFEHPKLAEYYLKLHEMYESCKKDIAEHIKYEDTWHLAVTDMREKHTIGQEMKLVWNSFSIDEAIKLSKIREDCYWKGQE